eukprot:5736594-Amphidinium_carterae.2
MLCIRSLHKWHARQVWVICHVAKVLPTFFKAKEQSRIVKTAPAEIIPLTGGAYAEYSSITVQSIFKTGQHPPHGASHQISPASIKDCLEPGS